MSRDVEPSLSAESHVKIYVRDDDLPLAYNGPPTGCPPCGSKIVLHRGPVPLSRRESRLGNRPEKQNAG